MEGHQRHLDVGCGPGTLIGLLDDRFISTGIDISTTEIDYARRMYESESKHFFAVSARALPDGCRDYDVATVVEVVEHLAPPNWTTCFGRRSSGCARAGSSS
jgi:2-polyprenyl-3-methyl-5-hydroxy-6-metoxy-1,4-benzoquinol methylase